MNVEPITTLLEGEVTPSELAKQIDEIWYEYAQYVATSKEPGINTEASCHLYWLRKLRNAFCAVDKLN